MPLKTSMNLPVSVCNMMSVFNISIIPVSWADGRTRREKSFSGVSQPVGATASIHDAPIDCDRDITLALIGQASFTRTSLVQVVCDGRMFRQYRRRLREGINSAVSKVTVKILILTH